MLQLFLVGHRLFLFSSVLLLTSIISLLLWYFIPDGLQEKLSFASPLPDYLTLTHNQQVRVLDLWLPNLPQTQAAASDQYTAQAMLSYDMTTNKTLFAKNINQHLAMASLTKLMTVIISLENPKADDRYEVSSSDIVGEDSMGLSPGEVMTQQDLLYGIFLNSGNDAAETIASNYPGGVQAFITAMNQKARALGLTDTNFTNPTGLQGDGDQHTSAYDLLVITKYLLENFPQILQISSQVSHTIPANTMHKEYDLSNEVNLISTYPGVDGLKDGYTDEAGWCLITHLNYSGHQIIGIILNSQDRRGEMKKLLDYSLQSESIAPPTHQ